MYKNVKLFFVFPFIESKSVQVHADGKRARPISQRTVVILRGIPEKTPVGKISF